MGRKKQTRENEAATKRRWRAMTTLTSIECKDDYGYATPRQIIFFALLGYHIAEPDDKGWVEV